MEALGDDTTCPKSPDGSVTDLESDSGVLSPPHILFPPPHDVSLIDELRSLDEIIVRGVN